MARVHTPDGLVLAAEEHGPRDRPTVVLVHGFPDDASLWDEVVPRLAGRHHVVAYDVRGAGDSEAPGTVSAYGFDHLVDDLVAVVDHVVGAQARVHLVGHDWGAIQGWEAVTRPEVAGRFHSFTAFSAPSLDHAGAWVRRRAATRSPAAVRDLAGQAMKSWYIAAFQVPWVPEAVLRRTLGASWLGRLRALEGIQPPGGIDAERATRTAVNGTNLYRANRGRLRSPRRDAVFVPTQVVLGERDAFVSEAVFADLEVHAPDAVRHVVPDAPHWLPRTHPEVVAAHVSTFVDGVEAARRDVAP